MSEDQIQELLAEAWDKGYQAGNLDGYFGTREEKNPYRDLEGVKP